MPQQISGSSSAPAFIRALMPDASEAAMQEATETVQRYLEAVLRAFDRLEMRNPQPDSRDTQIRDRFDFSHV